MSENDLKVQRQIVIEMQLLMLLNTAANGVCIGLTSTEEMCIFLLHLLLQFGVVVVEEHDKRQPE